MEEIIAILEALESDSSFCAEHTVPAGALRLTVKGAGPITLPLKPTTVQSLIDVAESARFGWREKTLFDKRIRNCWEIPAGRLKVAGRPWNATLKRALDEIEESSDPADDDNYVLQELIDGNVELKHWIDARGRAVRKPSVFAYNSEMCWTRATDEFNPFRSEYEGYMGNYGNTLDRLYRHCPIAPKETHRPRPLVELSVKLSPHSAPIR